MADNTNRLAGIMNLTIDGIVYQVAGEAKYTPAFLTRESLIGQDGVHGYKEMPAVGKMSATLRDSGGLTVGDLNQITNSTVVFGLANGKVVIGRNMWSVETQEAETEEGKVEVKFEGPSVTEG